MTAVAFQPQYRSLRLTLLSPTLPSTTGPIYHQCQAGMERSTVHLCSWNWWSNYCYYYYYQYVVGFCPTVLCSTRSDTVISKHCRRQSARRTPPVSVSVCLSVSICLSVCLLFDLRRVTVVAVQDSETRVSQLTALAGKLQQSVVSVHPFPLYLWTYWPFIFIFLHVYGSWS